jgi:hypothetical protein
MLRCFCIVEQYYFHASDFDYNYTTVPPFRGTANLYQFLNTGIRYGKSNDIFGNAEVFECIYLRKRYRER